MEFKITWSQMSMYQNYKLMHKKMYNIHLIVQMNPFIIFFKYIIVSNVYLSCTFGP